MRIEIVTSPQFELCYALADLVSPAPLVPDDWLPSSVRDSAWLEEARILGWAFWLGLPDILEDAVPAPTIAGVIRSLRNVPPAQARRRLVRGLFHSEGDVPASRTREWLAYLGLDDPSGESATRAALGGNAAALMGRALRILEQFGIVFEPIWRDLLPQLNASRDRAERLVQACSISELAQQLLLRAEVDEKRSVIKALRGGYRVRYDGSTRVFFMPSTFNRRRFWTAADKAVPPTIFFPYFDPAILFPRRAPASDPVLPLEIDPWLVCRALGDSTRAAIVRRIAARPQTAAELGAALRLSKANISHHVFQLREAGLIDEAREGRSVRLALRPQAIDRLTQGLWADLPRG